MIFLKIYLLYSEILIVWFCQIIFFFLFVVLLSSCIIDESGDYLYQRDKDQCGFLVDPRTGQGIRWKLEDLPVSFYIHESVPEEARQNFMSAVEHWNQEWEEYTRSQGEVSASVLFAVMGNGSVFEGHVKNDSYNMLFFTNKIKPYGMKDTTQAITKTYSLRRKIRDTDIIVNTESFQYYYDTAYNEAILALKHERQSLRKLASSQAPSLWQTIKSYLRDMLTFFHKLFVKKKYRDIAGLGSKRIPRDLVDFPSLMIHELGHVPGLSHVEGQSTASASHSRNPRGRKTTYSVMNPKLAYGEVRRNIGQYDLKNMFCGYYGE